MADNTAQNATDTIATDDVTTLNGAASSGVKVQRVKVGYGDDGTARDVSTTFPLPVALESAIPAGTNTIGGVNGGVLVSTTGAIGAGATGTVGPLNVATEGNGSFIVRNTTAASAWAGTPVIVFEQSGDNTSWSSLMVVRGDTGQVGSTFTLGPGIANGSLVFDCALEGVSYIRARVTTAPTTNGLTIDIAAGGMPFPQGSTVLAAPIDGPRTTYYAGNTVAFALSGVPISLSNPAASGKLLRVLWFRFSAIATTAIGTSFDLTKATTVSGGTSSTTAPPPVDSASAATVGVLTSYSVAPTSYAGVIVRSSRYYAKLAAADVLAVEYTFGNRPGQAIILRPGQALGPKIGTAITGGSVTAEFEFTEEPV